MKPGISFILTLIVTINTSAQSTFGERCLGSWEGMMHIYSRGALKDSVLVRLTVEKTNTSNAWTWRSDYLSARMPMTKDYIPQMQSTML